MLYLDTRPAPRRWSPTTRTNRSRGKFTEDHLALAIAIAHQAALAVEETRYHQAMVQAERLAAIGQTIAALSHHIKNILQGLVFGSDMVRSGMNDKDDILLHKGWKLVEKNQGKIYDLVMDMLVFQGARAGRRKHRPERHRRRRDRARGAAGPGRRALSWTFAIADDAHGAGRPGWHPPGLAEYRQQRPRCRGGSETPYVGVQTLLEPGGQWARIVVLDNGAGIPAEKVNDIFRPFVSTKGSRGTGLGLPVSRKILREHGGDIVVESKVGKGSKFILRLPMKSPLLPDPSGSGTTEQPSMPSDFD